MQLDLGEVKMSVRFRKEATVIGVQILENPHTCKISLVIEIAGVLQLDGVEPREVS